MREGAIGGKVATQWHVQRARLCCAAISSILVNKITSMQLTVPYEMVARSRHDAFGFQFSTEAVKARHTCLPRFALISGLLFVMIRICMKHANVCIRLDELVA